MSTEVRLFILSVALGTSVIVRDSNGQDRRIVCEPRGTVRTFEINNERTYGLEIWSGSVQLMAETHELNHKRQQARVIEDSDDGRAKS